MLPVSKGEVCRNNDLLNWPPWFWYCILPTGCARNLLEPLVGATPTSENKSAIELLQLPFPPWGPPGKWIGFTLWEPRSRYYICQGVSMGARCLDKGPPFPDPEPECRCTCPHCHCSARVCYFD